MTKRTVATCVMAVMFTLSAMVLNAQQPNPEMQQLYQEYMTLNQQLQSTQQKALNDPAIAKKSEGYSAMLDETMNEISPQANGLIKQRDNLLDNYEAAQAGNDEEAMKQIEQDFQQLESQIEPIRQQAIQQEDVQKKQQELEADVIEKMEEIEPKTPERIQRIQILQQELQKMMPGQ